jgi:hypothetical protein
MKNQRLRSKDETRGKRETDFNQRIALTCRPPLDIDSCRPLPPPVPPSIWVWIPPRRDSTGRWIDIGYRDASPRGNSENSPASSPKTLSPTLPVIGQVFRLGCPLGILGRGRLVLSPGDVLVRGPSHAAIGAAPYKRYSQKGRWEMGAKRKAAEAPSINGPPGAL